jgi:predicted nucleic acid-binding protein
VASVYFDSSVFLAIIGNEPSAAKIKLLLGELTKKKLRIVTSIITVQEVSVRVYQMGQPARDNYSRVSKLARILSVDKDTALTAAKYEAHALDTFKSGNEQEKAAENKRRKFDCFHMACAVLNGCGTLYSLDPGMLKRRDQFRLPGIAFLKPEPTELTLDLQPEKSETRSTDSVTVKSSSAPEPNGPASPAV